MLIKESSGGRNIFGHDGSRCADPGYTKGGEVDWPSYMSYRARRDECGYQGVGPCQLTWFAFQDRADALGGCWQPRYNCRVGFELLGKAIILNGYRAAFGEYNGGPRWRDNPSAVKYADHAMSLLPHWQRVVKGDTP